MPHQITLPLPVRTYDIDYMEEPYARGDAQAQGVEDAKEKIKLNPLR